MKDGEKMFERYRNLNCNSNVFAYEIGDNYVSVIFHGTRRIYRYSYFKAGPNRVETMKRLAIRGYGLNSYINNYCKKLYDWLLAVDWKIRELLLSTSK